jgi:hypothetical protein
VREDKISIFHSWNSSGELLKYMPAVIVASSLLFIAFVASSLGFVSPDSWNYLRLAESISNGDGCSVRGEYFAIFPCGYPAFISLTSWATGLDLFSASKLFNILALALSGLFFYLSTRSFLLGTLIVINPITLGIGHYTWSENAFLLAFALIFYASTKAFYGSKNLKLAVPLFAGLLVGLTSRYFFGPYAFLMFLAIWLFYGRVVAIKVLPYFAVAGIIFVGYYAFNKIATGHGSGMARISSPESFIFLFAAFSKYSVKQILVYSVSIFPLFIFFVYYFFSKDIFLQMRDRFSSFEIRSSEYRPFILMMMLGIIYLALSFGMRVYAQYDLYGYRTVGYGFVFFISAVIVLIERFLRVRFGWRGMLAILVLAGASIMLSQRGAYLGFLSESRGASYDVSFHRSIDEYGSDVSIDGIIVPFSVPSPKWSVSTNTDLFYEGEVKVMAPSTAPYGKKETYEDFRIRLLEYGMECHYDFTRVESISEFEKILASQYAFDVKFDGSFLNPELIMDNRYHSSISEHLLKIFSPGELIECGP